MEKYKSILPLKFRHPKAHHRQRGQFALLHTAGMSIIAIWMGVFLGGLTLWIAKSGISGKKLENHD